MNKCTYITDTPCHCAFFASSRCLIGLAFNTKIHDMVPADGTVVNNNIWKILWNMEKLFYCFFDRKNYFYPKPTKQQHSTKRCKRKSIKLVSENFESFFEVTFFTSKRLRSPFTLEDEGCSTSSSSTSIPGASSAIWIQRSSYIYIPHQEQGTILMKMIYVLFLNINVSKHM